MDRWLYQKTKTGATNIWRAWNEGSKIFTEYGQLGGKLQITVGTEAIATNVGRSNERNPVQQAEFEVEAMYKNQLRLKYSETVEESSNTRIQPMLASDGHKVKFTFPVDVQRKYDGLRCMRVEGGKLLSRGNKTYSVKHIEEELSRLFPENVMTDGELYIHSISLQQLNSLVKKNQKDSINLEYHIYDIPGSGLWKDRKQRFPTHYDAPHIHFVETFTVNSIKEIVKLHDQFIQEGYEGAIIRLPDGVYEFGKRSKSLLKWKVFEDKEFKIVGMKLGTGKMSECPIFACKNDINDKIFDVVPLGTMEARKEMLKESNIGKLLTVKFIGRTEDGIPKFAVGKVFRDEKDLLNTNP